LWYDRGVICLSLNSGSNGNCVYVEAGGARILFDAGISGKRAAERLAAFGRDVRGIDAVVISHDHADHICCAGILARKFKLPVYMTRRTYAAGKRYGLGRIDKLHFFQAGRAIRLADAVVHTYPTPHDAAAPSVFAVAAEGRRFGILTDLGHVFAGLGRLLGGLDAAFLESNYDPQRLARGPYPTWLKARIAGPGGHLSNVEAAELVRSSANGNLQWVALSHLSEVNNTPELALDTCRAIAGAERVVHVNPRYGPGELLRIE